MGKSFVDEEQTQVEKEDYLLSDIKKSSHTDEQVDENEAKHFVCAKCGSSFYSNSESSCVYCGEHCDISEDSVDIVNMYYLPFNNSIDDAKKKLKRYIRFKIFVPFIYRKKSTINSIKKVYIPAIIKDCNVNGNIIYYAADNGKNNSLIKYEVSHKVNVDFSNILCSTYSKIDAEDVLFLDDYDYSNLSLYSNNSIDDACCIVSDIDDSECNEKINDMITKYITGLVRDEINHNLKKIKENNTNIETKSEQKVLLPGYILNIDNGSDKIDCFINAQNGKVSINYDISSKKIIIFSIICFLMIFGLVFMLAWII